MSYTTEAQTVKYSPPPYATPYPMNASSTGDHGPISPLPFS
jgi:hypothetical protein